MQTVIKPHHIPSSSSSPSSILKMKFLLELVSCYRTQQSSSSSDTEEPPPILSTSRSLKAEETRSLVSTPSTTPTMPQVVGRMMRRKIMRRSRSSRVSGAGGDWKPTLFVISEDNVVPAPEKKVVVEQQQQKKKKVESKRCSAIVRYRGHDNFGHDPYRIAVPAFAPTPFMF